MTSPDNEFERLLSEAQAGRVSADDLLSAMRDQIAYVPVGADSVSNAAATFTTTEIDGARYVPAYSSEEQLVLTAGEVPRIRIPVRQLAELLPPQVGIALNWRAQAPGLPIMPSGVGILRGASNEVTSGSEVRIGEPARRPEEFLNTLSRNLASIRSVKSARFGLVQVGDSQPVFVVGVDESEQTQSSRSKIADLITRSSSAFPLEFQVQTYFLDANGDDGFRQQIVSLPMVYQAN
ncbi:enhanced serine sensitivity protein SseB C-terminal domain-containing protein [Nocardia sp. NBC_01388]|uniref:enhanced serine sensitivity protein SseB C-terminal domain-containing protein n=1 Tax=Nocardia sp. NBC_01388 TaxID=2903596 RepID=UPI00324CED10